MIPHSPEVEASGNRTAVISCQRNEALWLCEWVAYQRTIGFEQVFVISNDCTDGSDLLLDRLEEMGEVIHLRQTVPQGVAPQPAGCALALSHPLMADVDWAFHCDTDEFLNVSAGEGKVDDLLAAVGEADCIAVSWRMFGSGGRRVWDRGDVLPRCVQTQGQLKRGRALQKCLFRPNRFGAVVCHMPKQPTSDDVVLKNTAGEVMPSLALFKPALARHRSAKLSLVTWAKASLNHYAIKSEDLLLLKNVRGDGMAMVHEKYRRGSDFWSYADANDAEDRSILRHWPACAARLARYRADPRIAELEDNAWQAFAELRKDVLYDRGEFGWNSPPNSATLPATTGDSDVTETADPMAGAAPARPRRRRQAPDTAPATRFLMDTLPLGRPTVVVDVGANPLGDPPYKPLLDMGGCEIIGFEPQPEAFAALEAARSPRERYFPFAVGDGTPRELRIYRSSGMTSVFDPHLPSLGFLGRRGLGQVIGRQPMTTVALDSVGEIGRFDLLKIDIQGGEVDVFIGASAKLAAAMAVIVELRHLRLYESEPMSAGVDLDLRARGFILHKFLFNKSVPIRSSQSHRLLISENRDQLLDGDAVYIRDLADKASIDDEGLAHLAVLASGVFASHTLVLACLDELAARGRIPVETATRYVDLLPARLRRDP